MALHLNLFHEIHRQSERERRDPVKIAGLVGLLVMLCMVLWYFQRYSAVGALERQRRNVEANWNKLEPEMKAAAGNKEALLLRQKTNHILIDRLQGRFYWAPLLEKVASATSNLVQIVTLSGELEEDKEGKKTIRLLVRGIAASELPRTEAEAFRRTLQETLAKTYGDVSALFDANSLEDGTESVIVKGQSLPTATFRIRLQFTVAAPQPPASTPAPSGGTR